MGYSYEIQYKRGKDNAVADALCRVSRAERLCLAISTIELELIQNIQNSWQINTAIQQHIQ